MAPPTDAFLAEALDDLARLSEDIAAADRAMEDFRETSRTALADIDAAAATTFRRLESVLVRSLETGKFEWRDLARVAVDALGDIAEAQLEAGGAGSPFGGLFGGIGEVLGRGLRSVFGGVATAPASAAGFAGPVFRRQFGGPVSPGRPFLVGEDGPEIFVPPAPGEIVPHSELGATTVLVTYNVDARGAAPGVERRIVQALQQTEDRAVRRAMREVTRSAQRGGAMARLPRV